MFTHKNILSYIFLFALLGASAANARAVQSAPHDDQPHCPPVVQTFLENIGLFADPSQDTPPIVVIDLQGIQVDCLPRRLSPADQAAAARVIHETSQLYSHDTMGDTFHIRYGRACMVSLGRGKDEKQYLGLIVSYDPQQMTRPACIQRARSSIEYLLDDSG